MAKILLVEDDRCAVMWFRHALETEMGHTVLHAETEHEAIRLLKEQGAEIDSCILDQQLREGLGENVARHIRDRIWAAQAGVARPSFVTASSCGLRFPGALLGMVKQELIDLLASPAGQDIYKIEVLDQTPARPVQGGALAGKRPRP